MEESFQLTWAPALQIFHCATYAPNDLQQQLAFLRNLNNFLITNVDIGNLIVGGDWNVTLEAVDKKGGSQWKPTSYRNQLISMMKESSLIDVYRNLNPSKLCFTYESKALKLSSRIDFLLASQLLANRVSHLDTLVSIAPDHKAIRVKLRLENDNRGPGLWKFNNSLLEDEIYFKLITDSYAVIQNKYSGIEDKRLKWELIKMASLFLSLKIKVNSYTKKKGIFKIDYKCLKRGSAGQSHFFVFYYGYRCLEELH